MGDPVELGTSTLTRRERLERIATAERDRRAGRVALAIAALGEATEWPARAVLALARLPEADTSETRQILEEGLDRWAEEAGLDALDETPVAKTDTPEARTDTSAAGTDTPEEVSASMHGTSTTVDGLPELADPIDHGELDRAFAEAEAQTDEMHGANDVAERVLMQEPFGLAELDGDAIEMTASSRDDDLGPAPDVVASDAPQAPAAFVDAASVPRDAVSAEAATTPVPEATPGGAPSRAVVLATLERWLRNLEAVKAGRAR